MISAVTLLPLNPLRKAAENAEEVGSGTNSTFRAFTIASCQKLAPAKSRTLRRLNPALAAGASASASFSA